MSGDKIVYKVVQHDGGWAYKLGDVFSEPYRMHEAAVAAAHRVAQEQTLPDETRYIEYQDADGTWTTETASGDDRPEVAVEDEG